MTTFLMCAAGFVAGIILVWLWCIGYYMMTHRSFPALVRIFGFLLAAGATYSMSYVLVSAYDVVMKR